MMKRAAALFLLLAAPVFAAEETKDTAFDFANGLYARRMYAPAAAEYEKYIAANPASLDLASARFRLADSTFFTKDYKRSAALFEVFVQEFPKDERLPTALFRIGTSKFHLGDFPAASRIFSELSSQVSDRRLRAGTLFYQAKIHDAKEEPAKSVEILKEVFQNFPDTEYAAYAGLLIGERAIKEGKTREALEIYKIVSEKTEPAAVVKEAELRTAGLYYRQKEYDKAKGYFQRVFGSAQASQRLRERAITGLFYCDLRAGDLESALGHFEKEKGFIETSAVHSEVRYIVASLMASKNEAEKPLALIEQDLSDPKTPAWVTDAALFLKARILTGKGQSDPALVELAKLIDKNSPRMGQAYLEKARILRGLKRDAEAITAYEAVAENAGFAYRDALFEAGTLYLEIGEASKARGSFQKYVDQTPALSEFKKGANDDALYKLGFASANVYRFKEAAEAFQAIIEGHPDSKLVVEAIYGAAANFENAGALKEAIPFYEKLVRVHPDHPLSKETLSRLGSLYVRVQDLDKAAAFYQEILIDGKKDIPVTSDAAFWLVQYLLDNGKFENARKVLAELPSRFPNEDYRHETAYFTGEAFLGIKDTAKAGESFSEALALKPQGPYAPHAYLGMGLARAAAGDTTGAEAKFNEALAFDDEPEVAARARFEIASLRLKAGDFAEAAKAYMLVAVLFDHPRYSAEALYQAGQCFAKAGQAEDSQKALTELKTRYPNSEWARRA